MENDKLDLILQELKEHREEFKSITQELKTHTAQLTTIKKDVAEIKNIVNKGVYADIVRLEKRIEAIEQKQAI